MKKTFLSVLFIMLSAPAAFGAEISTLMGKDTQHPSKLFELSIAQPIFKYGRIIQNYGLITKGNFLSTPIFFSELAFGVRLEVPWFYAGFSQGLAWISSTIPGLNTHYQLPITLSVGLRTKKAYLGVTFKHFSNGTGNIHNYGRDFYCTEFGGVF